LATQADLWPGLSAVWWRQFHLDSTFDSISEADDELVTRAQWRAWIAVLESARVPWVNALWAARRAENKVVQLRCARSLGARVPATIVTNDVEQARQFCSTHTRAVIKTLASGYFALSDRAFVYTQEISAKTLDHGEHMWSEQPVLVQELVTSATADVRVVAFGNQCFGASHPRTTLDWRTTTQARWTPWPVPSDVAAFCRQYNEAMGLAYAAFDFLLADEALWFLEANQAGEWAFLDRALGLGISEALAAYLASLTSGTYR
jgi:glutathione synthase/RimK-type ligase-like ATP-grasp enzyme